MTARSRSLIAIVMIAALGATILIGGCGQKASTEPTKTDQTQPAEQPATNSQGEQLYTPTYAPNGQEVAEFITSKGGFTVKLYGTDAPIHVGNFVELVRKGFYDGLKFHRYEPGFVIQGGDPQTKAMSTDDVVKAVETNSVPLGTQGPGYVIKGEFDAAKNPNKHTEGALGMARTNDPDSAGSQFYFALTALAQLDGSYTVFGQVTDGLDVVKSLRVGDVIEKVEITGATE